MGDTAKLNAEWDAMGFHNHFFLPEGGTGQMICIWESKSDITAAEFQAFMDSEKAPGGGVTCNNEVHKGCQGWRSSRRFLRCRGSEGLGGRGQVWRAQPGSCTRESQARSQSSLVLAVLPGCRG